LSLKPSPQQNEGKINGMPIKEVDNFAEYVDYPVNKFLMTGEPEKMQS